MNGMQRLLARHRILFTWLLAASFAMKLIVPAGFMPVISAHSITIQLCDGYGAPMAMAGDMADGHDDHDGHHKPDKAQAPCAFALLSAPTLAVTDLALLTAAIAFIIATTFRATPAFVVQCGAYLRPPSQGPPATT